MLKSAKFWFPVFIAVFIGFILTILYLMGAAFGHGAQLPVDDHIAYFLYPYTVVVPTPISWLLMSVVNAELIDRNTAGMVLIIFLLFSILIPYPLYGVLIGYANFKGRVIPMLFRVLGAHILFYLVALLILWWR
jgi:hypothetical protein